MLLLTPDDSSIVPFQLGRHVDIGDSQVDDPGQVIGPTDGNRVFIYSDAIRIVTHSLTLSGLHDHEFLALEEFLNRELRGGAQPFTLSYGYGINLLSSSERFTPQGGGFPDWFLIDEGSGAPVVSEAADADVLGYAGRVDRVTFPGTTSTLRGAWMAFGPTFTDTVHVSMLARVQDGGADVTLNLDSNTTPQSVVVPSGGGFHRLTKSYQAAGASGWVDFNLASGTNRVVNLANVQVALGAAPPRFDIKPDPAFTSCRFLPGTLAHTKQKGLYNASLLIRQEVAA